MLPVMAEADFVVELLSEGAKKKVREPLLES